MTLVAYPVQIENGVVRSVDGSLLPKRANAVLVILPDSNQADLQAEWQQPFELFFATAQSTGDIDELSDDELNTLVHEARQPA